MANPAKKKKNPYFCIEFAGQEEQSHTVLDNLQQIRSKLTTRYIQPVGNLQVIEDLSKLWFDKADDGQKSVH